MKMMKMMQPREPNPLVHLVVYSINPLTGKSGMIWNSGIRCMKNLVRSGTPGSLEWND